MSFEKQKKNKSKTKRNLIKTLDGYFSKYIRLINSDENGFCKCITCGKEYFWKKIDCGHFISRQYHITRFDERNCKPQCISCNRFKQGEWLKFESKLIEIYGIEEIEDLKLLAKTLENFSISELNEKISFYRKKVKELLSEKGLL